MFQVFAYGPSMTAADAVISNQLLQTSHEDKCLSSIEVTKNYFLLNSALLLEAYLLQRSLFYRLFRM